MIDNPVEVEQLMRKMEEHLPIPARGTSVLVRFLRDKGIKLPASRRVEIESVHYLGDEGGIACGLKKPDSKEAVVVSLTHLRLEGRHPMAQDVRAYQIRRTAGLAREANNFDPRR
jgi:hypothetical protein